jgi:hypothetical protein
MRRGAQQHRSGVYGIGRMEHGRDGEFAAHALRRYYNFVGLLVKSVEPGYIKDLIILSFRRPSKWTIGLVNVGWGIRVVIVLSLVGLSISLCLQKLVDAVYKIQVLQ